MAFQPATKMVSSAKVGLFGPTGSGKTTLAAMLALYLSKKYYNGAPVAMLDSEKGADFITPFFEVEGVQLLVDRTRAFDRLRSAEAEAKASGACCLITDSVTHFWNELRQSFMAQKNVTKLDINMIGQIKDQWYPFADTFVSSPMHWIVCGRLGYEWENAEVEDEHGRTKQETFRGDTKMKAEGDFMYDPDLLVELDVMADPNAPAYEKLKGKRKKIATKQLHLYTVRKCRVRALNGKLFSFPDTDTYKAGDYAKVAQAFSAYFDFLNIGGEHVAFDKANSQGLFQSRANSEYYERQKQKDILIENWDVTLNLIFGGQDARTKSIRQKVAERITGLRSKTAFENLQSRTLERHLNVLSHVEESFRALERPADTEDAVLAIVGEAISAVDIAGWTPQVLAQDAVQGGPF